MTTHDDTTLDTTLAVLPPTVRTFVAAHLVHDTETELSCFEPDATVVDDGHTFRGLDEIRGLLTRAASEFTYTTTITEASADDGNTGDGAIIDQHGDGFRTTMLQVLEDLGWVEIAAMLRAALREVGVGRRDDDGGMLAKIGKLMRHAEGASTEAERDAFFAKAQELATANSVELALARASLASGESAPEPTFETVQLAHRGQQSAVRFVALMLAVARTNDLRCSIRSDNTSTTLYGFATDIEVAKSLYASLVIQMVSDADAYLRSGAHRPVHGRTARASFYAGWTARIGERLAEARSATQLRLGAVTRTVDETTGEVSEAKVPALVAKDVEVDDYAGHMMRQHGVRGSWRGAGFGNDGRSLLRGHAAAERARLGRSKELTG